jgi:hypothetical protein
LGHIDEPVLPWRTGNDFSRISCRRKQLLALELHFDAIWPLRLGIERNCHSKKKREEVIRAKGLL